MPVDAGMARKHAFDIAVEDGGALPEGLCEDGRGGAAADAGQGDQCVQGVRQFAAMTFDALLRRVMQIATAAVVAKS